MNLTNPPEVIFDRYFRNKVSPEERELYQGKLDLTLIDDEAMRDLLDVTQRSINCAYAAQRDKVLAHGKPPALHFDYARATVANAIAFQDEDCAFVGLTLQLFDEVGQTCALLSASDLVTEIFSPEKPTDHQRRQLLTAFFSVQVQFIASHELGHHFHGHCSGDQPSPLLWQEFTENGKARGGLKDQAKELDADAFAAHMMLRNFVTGSPRSKLLDLLGRPADEAGDLTSLEVLILAAGSFFFRRQREFERDDVGSHTHPPAAFRMHFVMEEVLAWLSVNRPSSGFLITQSRFTELMGAAANALSPVTSGMLWQAQTDFLLSPLGRDHLARLSEARSNLREDMRNRRWDLLNSGG